MKWRKFGLHIEFFRDPEVLPPEPKPGCMSESQRGHQQGCGDCRERADVFKYSGPIDLYLHHCGHVARINTSDTEFVICHYCGRDQPFQGFRRLT